METFEEAPDHSEFAVIHPAAIGHGHIMRSDADWDCQCFARLVGDQSERSSSGGTWSLFHRELSEPRVLPDAPFSQQ